MADAQEPGSDDDVSSDKTLTNSSRGHGATTGSGPKSAPTLDFAPPTLAAGVVAHPYVIVAFVVLFIAAGVAAGLARKPNYTASVEINVGVPDVASQATPGYSEAAITLAQSYSREADSVETWRPAARALHLPEATVAAALSGSTVPSSPTFYIHAKSQHSGQAIHIATAATAALVHKINVLDQGEGATPALLATYAQQQSTADQLQAAAGALSGSTNKAAITKARTAAAVAALRAQATASQYISSASSGKGAIIDILSPATSTTNDRNSYTERFAIVGLIVGLVVGISIAYLLSATADRRRRGRLA